MGRPSLANVRRAALIAATMEEIHAKGSLNVTMAGVAERAGLSAPLASYYFGSKDAMINEALRDMLHRLRCDCVRAVRRQDTPRGRLDAIVCTNFGPAQFQPAIISAWLNFYVRGQSDATAKRLLLIYLRRLRSNILFEAVHLLPRPRAEALADSLTALIDGYYLRHSLLGGAPAAPLILARVTAIIDLYLKDTS